MPVSRRTAEGLSQSVVAAYATAEVRLLQLLAKYLQAGIEAPGWAEAKLAELQTFRKRAEAIMGAATAEAVGQTQQVVQQAWLRGNAAGQGDLDAAGIRVDLPPQQAEYATEALVRAHADMLEDMGPRVVRQVEDGYRDAVVRASAGTLTGSATRRQDAAEALRDLADKGLTSFTDRAGRQWGIESYVDMATRTTTAQAAVQGHMDRLEQGGITTFLVSTSSRECDRCAKWEGKVLTRGATDAVAENPLTGQLEQVQVDGTVQEATRAGLFHPNCTHNLSAYIPGVTKTGASHDPEGYAEKQQQRAMERNLRKWKRREAAALDKADRDKARRKVREWQQAIRDHVDRTGLPRKRHRENFDINRPTIPVGPTPQTAATVTKLRHPADMSDDELMAELGQLMEDGDFGSLRMSKLEAELSRRDQDSGGVPATLTGQGDTTGEQAFLADLFSGNMDKSHLTQDRGDAGYLSGMTVKQQRDEYDTWAHSQWLRAEDETRGNLLNKRGVFEGYDASKFFDGSARPATIRKYATEELLRWFADNPRLSFDEFRALNGGGGRNAERIRQRLQVRSLSEWG